MKPKSTPAAAAVDAFLAEEQQRAKRKGCGICQLGPEVHEAIEHFLDVAPTLRIRTSVERLIQGVLKPQYGFTYSPVHLRAHINQCLGRRSKGGGP